MICGMMMLSLLGCGSKEESGQPGENEPVATAPAATEPAEEEAKGVEVADATELLSNVWNSYEEAELFAICGGDYENTVEDAPGKYDVSKAEEMDSVLGLPQDAASLIDDAASIRHMMNANTFTCGAFHLVDGSNQQALADGLKENIMGRQWMCGFPDTLLIVSVGDEYVVSAFGSTENIENLKTRLSQQYEVAEVMYEESLVE